MSTLYDALRVAHVASGTVALTAFWTTAAMKKGTPVHRRTGSFYMLAMLGVLATSPLLAIAAFARGRWVVGTFLLYLVLIAATAMWLAWHAVRSRRDVAAHYGASWRAVAWANLVGGAAVLALGLHAQAVVLGGMSLIGLFTGAQMLRSLKVHETDARWWMRRHVAGICACGIGTHIAFVNVGLARLVPPQYADVVTIVGWFAPVVAGVVAARVLTRRYAAPGALPNAA